MINCDNTPADRPPDYISFLDPNYSWPVIHLEVFSHFRSWASHISLQIRKIQPRGWKKRTNERTRTWVSSKRKKWGIYDTFVQLFVHLQANAGKYLHETSTKPLGMLTHLLTVSFSFSWLHSQANCVVLPTVVNFLSLSSLGPFFSHPLPVSQEISP